MFNSFLVIDLETPNRRNDSICSIALIHMAYGETGMCREYLVDPEASFDDFNIGLHRVTPAMVKAAPTFPDVWEEISGYFTNGIIVAHNASFDLTVIAKTLQHYDIVVPDIYYACTCTMARKHIPKQVYGCHKLNVLCDGLNITLEQHHNALADAKACRDLFIHLTKTYGYSNDDIQAFRYKSAAPSDSEWTGLKVSVVEKAMNTLYGILYGIGCDKLIKPEEYTSITDWMADYDEYRMYDQFYESFQILNEILEDSYISLDEYRTLMSHVVAHTSSETYTNATLAMQVMMGVILGIAGDGKVNESEAKELRIWMIDHRDLKGNYPYDKVFETLEAVLADGMITREEEQSLLALFKFCTNPEQTDIQPQASIDLSGKCCCLTGKFDHGSKEDIEARIVAKGGKCLDTLTKAVQYLIVGGSGSESWAYGNYGTKVKKAREMQSKKHPIQIIGEDTLFLDM